MSVNGTRDYDAEYKTLTIKNNFMFCKVMSNKKMCKMFLEAVLGIKIHHLQQPVMEQFIEVDPDRKYVRFDVYAEDDDFLFDIEMQVVHKKDLACRARYYQAVNDVNHLNPKQNYSQLKANIVLFLCDFDPFERDMPCYTFVNTCREDQRLELGDNTMKIFYNFNAYDKIKDRHVKGAMEYMATHGTSEYISKYMDELVEQAHGIPAWSKEYQCTMVALEDSREEGFQAGIAEGHKQGVAEGIAQGFEQGVVETEAKYQPLIEELTRLRAQAVHNKQ